jgi:hypothetical protein
MADDEILNPSMTPPNLLRAAARLIERALIRLDMREEKCERCSTKHYLNFEHAKVYQSLTDSPDKLERLAALLDGDPKAVQARHDRTELDRRLKQSRR